jgi:hypothetical protein
MTTLVRRLLTLVWRLRKHDKYNPPNNHGGMDKPCLKNGKVCEIEVLEAGPTTDESHDLYKLIQSGAIYLYTSLSEHPHTIINDALRRRIAQRKHSQLSPN